jgi:hypothetical protein
MAGYFGSWLVWLDRKLDLASHLPLGFRSEDWLGWLVEV